MPAAAFMPGVPGKNGVGGLAWMQTGQTLADAARGTLYGVTAPQKFTCP